MQELYELKEKKMCNNAFLLGKLMDNQSSNSAYVPSANYDVRSRILNGGSQGIHPIYAKEYIRIPKSSTPEHHGLIANELVSVQPLPAPINMTHYLDYQYKSLNYTRHSDGTIVLITKRNRKLNNKIYYG